VITRSTNSGRFSLSANRQSPHQEESWAKTPIDRFILARLEAHGLKPVKAADKRTLIRRATFDLIGLPAHSAGGG